MTPQVSRLVIFAQKVGMREIDATLPRAVTPALNKEARRPGNEDNLYFSVFCPAGNIV